MNGVEVKGRTVLKHCDRILWGSSHSHNRHLFRVNCTLTTESRQRGMHTVSDPSHFDYEMAKSEVLDHSASNGQYNSKVSLCKTIFLTRNLEKLPQNDKILRKSDLN